MSRKANCWDNAPMESFFGTLKTELVHRQASMIRRAVGKPPNTCSLRHSSRKRPLKLSTKAFWTGFPGAM